MRVKSNKFLVVGLLIASLIVSMGCLSIFSRTTDDSSQVNISVPNNSSAKADILPVSAKVTEVQGKAEIKTSAGADFTPASKGNEIEVGGQVSTQENGHVRLDLSSGTIIRLAPNSIFTLESNVQADSSLATKLNLELGKVFVILNGGSLDISTGAGVASVRGSYMSVTIDIFTKNVVITCLEGKCSADDKDSNLDFSNGEKVILYVLNENGEHHKADKVSMVPNDFYDWMNEVPEAKDMIVEISHNKGIEISVNNCAPNCGGNKGSDSKGGGSNGGGDHNGDGHEDKGKTH